MSCDKLVAVRQPQMCSRLTLRRKDLFNLQISGANSISSWSKSTSNLKQPTELVTAGIWPTESDRRHHGENENWRHVHIIFEDPGQSRRRVSHVRRVVACIAHLPMRRVVKKSSIRPRHQIMGLDGLCSSKSVDSVVSLLPQDKSSPKRVRTSSSILLITGLPPKAPTNRFSVSRIVDRALACTQAGQRSFTESGSNQIYSNGCVWK